MRRIRYMKIVIIAAAVVASLVGTATVATAATAVTSLTVSATSYVPATAAVYTVGFRATGGLVPTTPTPTTPSTITLTGLSGNLPTSPGSYVVDAQAHAGTVTALTTVASGVQLTVPELLPTGAGTTPLAAVNAGSPVTVTVSGVTNPAAGSNSISVNTSVDTTPVTSAPFTIGTGATQLLATGGDKQSAPAGTVFPIHLGASLKDSSVPPVAVDQAGVPVVFTVVTGSTGAGGTFPNSSGTTTVNTGTTGVATAPLLTANANVGAFSVSATTTGLTPNLTATFTETNGTAPVTPPTPPAPPTPPTSPSPSPADHGYWLVGGDGGIFTFGSAAFHGSTGSLPLSRPVVGIVPTASRQGYWLDAADGGVFAFNTGFYGSIPGLGILPAGSTAPGRKLAAPVVGMVPSADGLGYFMVASDGGVFAFGDAVFAGSCPAIGGCSGAAVAVMPDHTGNGYWLVTATGSVYGFGDAPSLGAPGNLGSPVTSAVRTSDGNGYWILLANGTVRGYGDAANLGGPVGVGGLDPATAIFATATGGGYWVAQADGSVFPFGDAPNDGGMNGMHLNKPIIAGTGW